MVGEDAAVIDLGEGVDHYCVVTSDPITFTTEEIGYYGVVVNLNDIATMGAIPKWFLATLLFPEDRADLESVEKVFKQRHTNCSECLAFLERLYPAPISAARSQFPSEVNEMI